MKVFGTHEQKVIDQLDRCVRAEDGAEGVLCADGHFGYSQPVGGAVAYRDHISPAGVGYDIGCIASGEPVSCVDGTRAIEDARDPLCADRGGAIRLIEPFIGAAARGVKRVVRITLANGRSVRATPDHRFRTERGWREASALTAADRVLCPVHVGLPSDFPLSPALLRIAGYANGDGHLSRRGSRVTLYTSKDRDAAALASDLTVVGCTPSVHRRVRPNGSIENAVYVNSADLRERLRDLGCITGRKAGRWTGVADAVLALPLAARACYVSAFASAEMSTPRLHERRIQNLAVKQRGADAAEHAAVLLRSLGFEVGVSRSDGANYAVQILGGEDAQVQFIETIGFNRAADKRRAATQCVAVAWERVGHLAERVQAQARVRQRMAAGERVRDAIAATAAEAGMTDAAVHHLAYRRAPLRRMRGWRESDHALNECAYSAVVNVEPAGEAAAWDLVTGDAAEAFIAGGMVVHNCGNKAVLTDLSLIDVNGDLPGLADEIESRISFGVGVPAQERADHPVLDEIRESPVHFQRALLDLAAQQLGTVGGGNHYVDVFADEAGRVWVGVHFGSRGFGHKTASRYFGDGPMEKSPDLLAIDSERGQEYIAAMEIAGRYAYAGRDVVVAKVLEILGADAVETVHNHHNYAWRETHGGEDWWVVRKGCTPAFPGQRGFVGATMAGTSVILEGVEHPESAEAFYSTVHGAGRAMSRTAAAGKSRKRWACMNRDCDWVQTPRTPGMGHKDGTTDPCPKCGHPKLAKRWVKEVEGAIDWPTVAADIRARGIELRGANAEEAPAAYKDLLAVLGHHADTVRRLHELRPVIVAMAPGDVQDPYKD